MPILASMGSIKALQLYALVEKKMWSFCSLYSTKEEKSSSRQDTESETLF